MGGRLFVYAMLTGLTRMREDNTHKVEEVVEEEKRGGDRKDRRQERQETEHIPSYNGQFKFEF